MTTYKDIEEALRKVGTLPPHNFPKRPSIFKPLSHWGLDIIEYRDLLPEPKIQLSATVMMSDEFRIQMNAWLAETFGYHQQASMLKPGTALVSKVFGIVVMRSEDIAKISHLP